MSTEKENFYRNSTLIVDDAKEAFIDLLDLHLTNEGISFLEFLEKHHHEIYHLCYNNAPCCICPQHARGPTNGPQSRILHPSQLDLLFDITSTKQPGHNPYSKSKHCCLPVNGNIKKEDLDFTLTRCLLVNFTNVIPLGSNERQAVEELVKLRNVTYGHASRGLIPHQEYDKIREQIENCLLTLGRKCGKEDKVRQKLKDAKVRTLDETIYHQLHSYLLMSLERDENLQKVLPEIVKKTFVETLGSCTDMFSSIASTSRKRVYEGDQALTEQELLFIARQLGKEGKHVLITLDIKSHEIEQIQSSIEGHVDQMHEGLLKWKRTRGECKGIRDILFDAIIDNGRKDVVDDFKRKFLVAEPESTKKANSEVINEPVPTEMMPAEKCIVAGLRKKTTPSILDFSKSERNCLRPLRVMIKAISEVTGVFEDNNGKIFVLLYDGITCLQGVAFGTAAKTVKELCENDAEVVLSNYGVRSADQTYTRTKFEIRIRQSTSIEKCNGRQIESIAEQRFNIEQLQNRKKEKMFASSKPVIITAIGESQRQVEKYLREIYVKDKTGKMKVKFWSNSRDEFEYEIGNIVQFKHIFIDVFQNEMFLQRHDLSVVEKCDDNALQCSLVKLLDGEDPDELSYKRSSLAEIKCIRQNRKKIIIEYAVLTKFAKEEEMIYMQCIVKGHGPLLKMSKKGGKYFCNDCKKNYVTGDKVTCLKAQFSDGLSSTWATLYTASSKLVLGENFQIFHKMNIKKEECFSILRHIEREKRKYKLFLSVRPFEVEKNLHHNVTVQSLRKCDI